jgi:urease accessory protein
MRIVPLALSGLAAPAFAHPGHDLGVGFAAGFVHPLTGLDHLLVMVMVGLWAGIAFPKHAWLCPAIFVTFMLAGFTFGAGGGHLPIAEMLITASLAGLGLALMLDVRPPLAVAIPVIAMFAIGHGFAHGGEMGQGTHEAIFAAGFVTTTILLHMAGIALSRMVSRAQPRRIGQAMGLAATATAITWMWSA